MGRGEGHNAIQATEDCIMTSQTHVAPGHATTHPIAKRHAALIPALAAIALGFVFVFGTGFVQISAVHNGAHDSRHSFAFPCH